MCCHWPLRRQARHVVLGRVYGGHRMFSVAEVRAGTKALRLAAGFLPYAYALFCTGEAFDAHQAGIGTHEDYLALRSEMRPPLRRHCAADGGGGGD